MEGASIFTLIITILNILLTTIPSLIDKGEQIKNFKRRLERYCETLENCRMSMDIWGLSWQQNDESDYQALFGLANWSSMQRRRDRIQDLLENISSHLLLKPQIAAKKRPSLLTRFARLVHLKAKIKDEPTGVEQISEFDIRVWQLYSRIKARERDSPLLGHLRELHPGVIKRIIGVLYANQQLDSKFNELQEAIAGLHKFSMDCFNKMGHGQEWDGEEVAESLRLDRLQKIAGEIYESHLHRKQQYQWTLELQLPRGVDASNSIVKDIARRGMIHFTVRHRSAPNGLISSQELTARHLEGALDPRTPTDPLDSAMRGILSQSSQTAKLEGLGSLELSQAGTPESWTKSLRFWLIESRKSKEVQMIFSLERARIAYGCALWIILLWRTDWFANLCSCGFRSATYPNQARLSMSPMVDEEIEDGVTRHEYVFRSQPRENREHPCPRNYSPANKLYLLGILLAELYLSEAIDLRLVDGHLEPSDSQQFTSNLDIVTRMEQYPEFGRKHPVVGAVDFCFRNAVKEEWAHSQQSITKLQLDFLIDRVLVPAFRGVNRTQTYFQILKGHYHTTPWAYRFADEYQKLVDNDGLTEEDEHFTLAME